MGEINLKFENILVINFGQMGDVILSLPALDAIRGKFPKARITLMLGKPGSALIRGSTIFDDLIVVDRVELRDGNKLTSIAEIARLIRDVRRRRFDLVIDLHSLSETNLLGYVSGARHRLYANRESRSLDSLGRFPSRPPAEDKAKHCTDRYFDVVKPLGISRGPSDYRLTVDPKILSEVEIKFENAGLAGPRIVGMSVGAGHPSRCWQLEKFAELARTLVTDANDGIAVFLGPEEKSIASRVHEIFPVDAVVFDNLNIRQLHAATTLLETFVSNDSGPAHIAGISGCPLVLIMDKRAPMTFLPLAKRVRIVNKSNLDEISVAAVAEAVSSLRHNG